MSVIAGLPQWVWDLVRAVERYEEEHPSLYRMGDYVDGALQYDRAECPGAAGVLDITPRDVRDQARAIDEYVRFANIAKPDLTSGGDPDEDG